MVGIHSIRITYLPMSYLQHRMLSIILHILYIQSYDMCLGFSGHNYNLGHC